MIVPVKRLAPQPTGSELQPLREVGTMEKTQFWDIDDVMEALRIANRHGISLTKLRSVPTEEAPALKAS
ncbi:MAG TPA: hypothetical protein VHM91_08770 [Verrucomicrobiales bacterium]|jgi:hypothetical protein|nr:hypothetical protein [Verrucomicrobiales bacterium]